MPLTRDEDLSALLSNSRTIAVIGASDNPARASYGVSGWLADHGWRVIPVNPRITGEHVHNEYVWHDLSQVGASIDIVDVFRRSEEAMDAVEQAIWTRQRGGKDLAGLIAPHDHGVQYMSVAYSERLDAAGIKPSTGAVGSSYDNALAESVIGLHKTELIKPRRPWKGFDDLGIATAEWVDWFNNRRLLEPIGNIPPAEAEANYYAMLDDMPVAA